MNVVKDPVGTESVPWEGFLESRMAMRVGRRDAISTQVLPSPPPE
jgi:hypothetical protein